MSLHGVDLSNNNDDAHIASAIASSNNAFILAKASEGEHTGDSKHASIAQATRAANKALGHYHFAHPTQDPIKEAANFLAQAGARPGEVLALDLEASEGSWQQRLDYALKWLAYVKNKTGGHPFFYTYTSYITDMLSAATSAQKAELLDYPLWIADPNNPAGHPSLGGWALWTVHQYGIIGGLDNNLLNGGLNTWAALAIPAPAPNPAPQTVAEYQRDKVLAIAKHEADIHYQEGYANGHWDNIQKYSEEVPNLGWSDGQAWCAVFVSWCAWKAGMFSLYPNTASCSEGVAWFKQQGRWSDYPAIGAQAFFGPGGGTHTGIVYNFDADTVYYVSGNSNNNGSAEGDGVYYGQQPRRSSYVFGYGYPNFAEGIQSADPAWASHAPKPLPTPTPAPTPAKAYTMVIFGQSLDTQTAAAACDAFQPQGAVSTGRLDIAKAALAAGDVVVAVGGPANTAIGFTGAKDGQVVVQGKQVAIQGATAGDTYVLLGRYLATGK